MIFRMDSDQTRTWLSGELATRAILQRIKDTFWKKKYKGGQLKYCEHRQALKRSWHPCGCTVRLFISPWCSCSHVSFFLSSLLLCPRFLQFLSTSSLLPSLLIRGTPQRWRIIPVRSSESFMSWEDTLARALPALFPLRRYLHQLPGLAVSLFFSLPPSSLSFPHCAWVFTHVYVLLHYGAHRFCQGRD